ncbi:MAG TPA: hypothetical protein VGP71_12435 [Burkholderiales bacterium]|nr:hypothetical protein [Burkholderiales bacterium]
MPQRTDHDIAEARKLQQQLKAIFQSYPGDRPGATTLLRVRALCAIASRSVNDTDLKAKMGQVENCAGALFSVRKHQPVPGDQLRRQVFAALDAFDSRLHDVVAMRQAASAAAAQSEASEHR